MIGTQREDDVSTHNDGNVKGVGRSCIRSKEREMWSGCIYREGGLTEMKTTLIHLTAELKRDTTNSLQGDGVVETRQVDTRRRGRKERRTTVHALPEV